MATELGRALKDERRKKGVTHAELADLLRIDEQMLYRYQRGDCKCPDDVVIRAAQVLESDSLLVAHPVVQAWIRLWLPEFPEA